MARYTHILSSGVTSPSGYKSDGSMLQLIAATNKFAN